MWLPRNSNKKFMFGDSPSIADLCLAVELAQLEGIMFHKSAEEHPTFMFGNKRLTDWPSIHKWLYTDMMSIEGYRKVHSACSPILIKTIGILHKRKMKKKGLQSQPTVNHGGKDVIIPI